MLAWFQALMPKEERFFPLFAQQSQLLVAGAEALRAMLQGGEAVSLHCKTVMDREHDADDVTREVLIAVRRTFITPFDRGDIKDLITVDGRRHRPDAEDRQGDHAVRGAHASSRRCARWATSIVECARLVARGGAAAAAPSTSTPGALQRHHRADHADRRAGRRLARRGPQGAVHEARARPTPWPSSIGAEIYDHLEKVVDRFEDVANEISGIVIEHV